MPNSNDNQDYGESDQKNKEKNAAPVEGKMTSDDLKGKKIDADLDLEKDKPAQQGGK
ncbi:MAG TPA: hypothetical protein VF623_11385 [Segetibacter sp.]|jgi:hypothetical protein